MTDMSHALAEYLRDLADKVEDGRMCNGEVWDRLNEDGP